MHIELYQALKSQNVSDEQAERVVKAMDAHVETRVGSRVDEIKALLGQFESRLAQYEAKRESDVAVLTAKIDGLRESQDSKIDSLRDSQGAKIDSLRESQSNIRWFIVTAMAVVGLLVAGLNALFNVGLIRAQIQSGVSGSASTHSPAAPAPGPKP